MTAKPAHCVVCVNVGDMTRPADTTAGDYLVCTEHATYLDGHATLADALKHHRTHETRRETL